MVNRPQTRGLSQAALETLAIVAYLGPVSRPEIARIRGVAADAGSPACWSAALSKRRAGPTPSAIRCSIA